MSKEWLACRRPAFIKHMKLQRVDYKLFDLGFWNIIKCFRSPVLKAHWDIPYKLKKILNCASLPPGRNQNPWLAHMYSRGIYRYAISTNSDLAHLLIDRERILHPIWKEVKTLAIWFKRSSKSLVWLTLFGRLLLRIPKLTWHGSFNRKALHQHFLLGLAETLLSPSFRSALQSKGFSSTILPLT